jgi:hypothetical protein
MGDRPDIPVITTRRLTWHPLASSRLEPPGVGGRQLADALLALLAPELYALGQYLREHPIAPVLLAQGHHEEDRTAEQARQQVRSLGKLDRIAQQ